MIKLAYIFLLVLTVSGPSCRALSSSSVVDSSKSLDADAPAGRATIAVCTGPDCRVDGSSGCLKAFQGGIGTDKSRIRVTGRACVGPCGDGPCVMVLNDKKEKVVVNQPSKIPISLASPDLFGSNPGGWYQVRTAQQVQEVLEIARKTAGVVSETEPQDSTVLPQTTTITSTRPWYDRPRNERKFLQRLMQFTVVAGLAQYDKTQELGDLQYGVAGVLLLLSTGITKENVWNALVFKRR
ncbi:expressed unknown protein [Seminavis robusta]|uniref:Uncharacterized protein n=1 Tax=Seminavis robusta TaxID=568900 RepID=A0A9N8DTP3_9STRA|nr:expressed unknown protein [Seminavis robusta]|eukprot:Sro344_g122180.1 n/a (239) ;mRNA; r:23085-23801